jgi:hypothetical protein
LGIERANQTGAEHGDFMHEEVIQNLNIL